MLVSIYQQTWHNILNLWFKSYLLQGTEFISLIQTDCTNFTLNRYSSSSRSILHGVPQGSIFWSLVFLVYINDLLLILQIVNFVLYADDTNILVVDKEEEEALQHK